MPVKANSICEGLAKGINAGDKVKSVEEIELTGMYDLWSEWRSMHQTVQINTAQEKKKLKEM